MNAKEIILRRCKGKTGMFNKYLTQIASGIVLMMLFACGSIVKSPDPKISFETIDVFDNSGFDSLETIAIRDLGTWVKFWPVYKKNIVSPPLPPTIDFSKKMVVGVALGGRGGCGSVRIKKIYRAEEKIIVEYSEGVPFGPRGCLHTQIYPAHLVTIPRSPYPIEFFKALDTPN